MILFVKNGHRGNWDVHRYIRSLAATLLALSLGAASGGVLADAGQVTLLFQNLIANAIKFRREGPPQIHISAEQDADSWTFAVRDNGIGIEPEYMVSIFDVFQRLHSPAKYAGTGIGLAICKRIVERHKGRLWVESEPGVGSTFFIRLPMEVTQAKWPDTQTQA